MVESNCRTPPWAQSHWPCAPPPCLAMWCQGSLYPHRRSQDSCSLLSALRWSRGKPLSSYRQCYHLLAHRHDMAETFRACLGLVYTCYTERLAGPGGEPVRLETLVSSRAVQAKQSFSGWESSWNLPCALSFRPTPQVFPRSRRPSGNQKDRNKNQQTIETTCRCSRHQHIQKSQ